MKIEKIKDIATLVARDLNDHIIKQKYIKSFTITFSIDEFCCNGCEYEKVIYRVKDDALIINIAYLLDHFEYDMLFTIIDILLTRINRTVITKHTPDEITRKMLTYIEYRFKK